MNEAEIKITKDAIATLIGQPETIRIAGREIEIKRKTGMESLRWARNLAKRVPAIEELGIDLETLRGRSEALKADGKSDQAFTADILIRALGMLSDEALELIVDSALDYVSVSGDEAIFIKSHAALSELVNLIASVWTKTNPFDLLGSAPAGASPKGSSSSPSNTAEIRAGS